MRNTLRSNAIRAIALAASLMLLAGTFAPMAAPPADSAEELTFAAQIGGFASAVAADEQYVYLGAGPRLSLLDVSDARNPVVVGSVRLPYDISAVAVSGSHAYVTLGLGGLYIVDIANPASPELVGLAVTFEGTRDVAVAGGYAFVADEMEGVLRIIDVSRPDAPNQVGSFSLWGITGAGAGADPGIVYATSDGDGLTILSVADPANPAPIGAFSAPGARDVFVAGTTACVISPDGLILVDVANPAAPAELGRLDTPGDARRVTVQGGFAYVADGSQGLRVIRVDNPAAPADAGFLDTPGDARDVALLGDLALVADGSGGLRIVSVANPSAPAETGVYEPGPGHASGVAVQGDYAYVAEWDGRLWALDVSDPAHPALAGSVALPGFPRAVTVSGDLAYVSCAPGETGDPPGGVSIVNVADPAHPALLANYPVPPRGAFGVALKGTVAFIAAAETGMIVVDVSDPAQPRQIGTFPTQDARGIAIHGDLACVADVGWLKILNIANPAQPVLVQTFDEPCDVVAAGGGWLFAAQGINLRMIDVSRPGGASPLAEYAAPAGTITGIHAQGRYVFLSLLEGGVRVLRVTGECALEEIAFYDAAGWPSGVALSGAYNPPAPQGVHVTTWRMGLQILSFVPRVEAPTPTPRPTPTPHPPARYRWYYPFVWLGAHGSPYCGP